jgi:hypothetical protein
MNLLFVQSVIYDGEYIGASTAKPCARCIPYVMHIRVLAQGIAQEAPIYNGTFTLNVLVNQEITV